MNHLEPETLVSDAAFQNTVSLDAELQRLFNEQLAGKALRDAELMLICGGEIIIGEYRFPPLTAASLCLLDVIESPLINRNNSVQMTTMTREDICKALYIMQKRENAVPPVIRVKQHQLALERLQEIQYQNPSRSLISAVEKAQEQVMASEKIFSSLIMKFYNAHPGLDLAKALNILNNLLLQPGGFAMLPQNMISLPSKKRRLFDANWLTGIVTQVSEVTHTDPFTIKWRLSMAETSYYIIQRLRRTGVKGISEKTKSAEAMQRLKHLMMRHMNKLQNKE